MPVPRWPRHIRYGRPESAFVSNHIERQAVDQLSIARCKRAEERKLFITKAEQPGSDDWRILPSTAFAVLPYLVLS